MTKLEECARAIDCEAFLPSPIQKAGRADFEHQARQSRALHQASAVIRCLMEPDEAMLDAAARQLKGMTFSDYPANQDKAIFRAMLQAALDEGEGT